MTICVAALYGNGAGVVLASDQMVTAHFPIGYEFEHDETKKILPVTEKRLRSNRWRRANGQSDHRTGSRSG